MSTTTNLTLTVNGRYERARLLDKPQNAFKPGTREQCSKKFMTLDKGTVTFPGDTLTLYPVELDAYWVDECTGKTERQVPKISIERYLVDLTRNDVGNVVMTLVGANGARAKYQRSN